MDEELKTYLEGKFAGLDAKLADVDAKFAGLDAKFAGLDAKFADVDAKFAESEAKFREAIHDSETRLLSEFWKWGRVTDQRIRRVEASDATTAERLTAMEDRLFTLERKVAGSKE